MPGDDGATPLQESMKQDYEHISKHDKHILYFGTTTLKIIWLLTLTFLCVILFFFI